MIALARTHGAAAKLCGSGGAVVGIPQEESDTDELAQIYRRVGFDLVHPELAVGADGD